MIMVEHDRTLPPRSGNSQHQQHQQQQQQQQQLLQGRETGTYEQIEHQSAPTTPSPPYQYAPMQQFAHQHQQHSVRSTPTSYPSPASYPSPSMTAYAYPVPALPQGHNSPNVQAMNASGYSLPPIRMTPPTSSLPPAGMPMGGTPSLTAPPPGAIYYPPPQPYNVPVQPSITASQISQPGRYSHTPGATERIMSGGRHKKEIKRRTKTGCLTCRKRRIKCDEAHPSCKNCAKSKRECLGYDPIFKSQTGPPPILPPVQSGSIPSSAIAIHPNGMAYGHANTAPPPMAVSQPTYAYGPPMSTAENSPAPSCEPYEFNVIDPALESTPIPMVQPANTQFGMAGLVHDSSMGPRLELKRGYDHTSFDRTSPLSSADSARLSVTPGVRSGSPSSLMKDTLASNKAKRIKIDDLLGKTEERGGGSPLTPPSAELTSHSLSIADMQYIYRTRYGPVLDALVETRWFQTKGLERVMLNDQFANSFVAVLIRIHNRSGTYIPEDVSVPKFCGDAGLLMESVRILWGTRASCTMAPAFPHDCENDYTDNADLMNRDLAIRRLSIIESLLSPHHITLDNTGFSSSSNTGTGKAGSLRGMDESQTNFWNALERFVSLPFRAENIMSAQKSLEEISHNTMDIRFRELLFRIAEAKFFKFRLDGMGEHYPDQDNATSYNSIFRKAADYVNEAVNIPPESNFTDADLVAQRIAGRALGLWGCPQNSTNLAIF